MKLSAEWMAHEGTVALCSALYEAGYQALFVGGCVRNGLIGAPVRDIDIATDARPEKVMALVKAAGLRAIPTGFDHGTITVIAGGKPHEVTSFRKDVETFGRHATVAYSADIADDAARRDFTMNALYAGTDGVVLDPVGEGLDDLRARRLRFIGSPEDRINEDYLRILRFFRFHAWYADPDAGFDADGLAACAALSSQIETLSKERIGAEMKKLLSAPDPERAVATMAWAGVLAQVLPGATPHALPLLVAAETTWGVAPDPMRRLACLGSRTAEDHLRLSRAEARQVATLQDEIGTSAGASELGYCHGADMGRDIVLLRAATLEHPLDPAALDEVVKGATATFPVSAADLMPALQGPALGQKLAELERCWIASGFTLDRETLLA